LHDERPLITPTVAPVIAARGVAKSVGSGRGARTLLRDLDLSVGRGELVAVIGRSGSGKSTLLHVLGGLDRPDAGEIELDGVRIDRCSDPAPQVGVGVMRDRTEPLVFVQRCLPFAKPLHLPHPVQRDGDRDAVKPGAEGRVSAKPAQLIERANERVLREILSQLRIATESIDEPVHPGGVRLVQLAPGHPVSVEDTGDQRPFVQRHRLVT